MIMPRRVVTVQPIVVRLMGGKGTQELRRGNVRQGVEAKRCQLCGKLGPATRDCRSGGPRNPNTNGNTVGPLLQLSKMIGPK